ncbi:MAG: CPBP family intramembrane metalloprotease [Pirellulaceae bacterium]|nr:CPBP family intramembrane metalloprotease [Pirellulaceae bacterium]
MLVMGQIDADFGMLLFYSAAGSLAFVIVDSIRKRKLGKSTYSFRFDSLKTVPPLVIASVALLFGVIGPLISLIPMPSEVGEGFAEMIGQRSPAMFITLVIAAPILEELLFRGIMLDGLLKRYRPLTAILVSSIIFGLAHLNPWQFVTAFCMGCFAGWVYYRTHSIGPCILIHATINLCAYSLQVLFNGTNVADQSQAVPGGWGAFLVFPAMCLMVIFVSVLYLRQEFNRVELAKVDKLEDQPFG